MATYKGIHVAFVADISDVGRKIRLIDSQAKDLDKTLAQVNKSLKLDPNNADLVAQKMRTIEEESDLLRQKLEQLKRIQQEMATVDVGSLDPKKAEAYRASLTRVNAEIAKTQAALLGLSRQAEMQTQQEVDKLKQLQAEIQAVHQAANQDFTKGISQISTVVSQVSRAVLLVEAALVRLGVSAVKTGAEFDASMSQLAATLDIEQVVNQQEHAFARLRNQALEYGKVTVYTASQAAEALNYLALGGLGVEKSMEALPQVLTLAKAGSMELDKAANIVVASMSALNLETEDIDTLMDQMARTAQKSKVTVEQLGEATLKSASAFNLAGQDTATMNAILGVLGNRFENIADQANTLRTALNRVSTYSDEIKKLGVDVEDSEGHVRNFIDIFADLNRALEDKTDTERTSILTKIFGQRGFSYASYLMQSTNGEIQALKKTIEEADGAATQMAETMTDNLQSDMIIVKSAMENLAISITDKLNPSLREAANNTTNMLNSMSDDVVNGEFGKDIEELGRNVRDLVERIVHTLADNGPTIVKLTSSLVENADKLVKLYMVFKGGSLLKTAASGIVNITNGIRGTQAAFTQASELASQLSQVTGLTAAQTAELQAAQASASTAARTGLMNVASAATMAAAAVGTLIASFIDAKAAAIDVTNAEWQDDEMHKYLDGVHKVQETLQETRKTRESDIDSIVAQTNEYEKMADRIEELAVAEDLSESKKQEMHSLINQLNEAIPSLNLLYDDNTRALNMNNEALDKAIENYQNYQLLLANQKYVEELATQKVKYEMQLEDVQAQLPDASAMVDANQQSLAQILGLDFRATEQEINDAYNKFLRAQSLNSGITLFGAQDYGDADEIKNYYSQWQQAKDAFALAKGEELNLRAAIDGTNDRLSRASERVSELKDNLGDVAVATGELSEELQKQYQIAVDYYEAGEEGKDALAKQIEQYPELIDMLESAGYDMSAFSDATSEASTESKSFEEEMKSLETATKTYKSELKDLLGVLSQVQQGTAYSTSQILDLIEKYPQLAGAIRQTADGYIIEADAVRRLTEAQAENTVKSVDMQIAAVQAQLSDAYHTGDAELQSSLREKFGQLQELKSAYNEIAADIRSGQIFSGSTSSSSGGSSSGSGTSSSSSDSSADDWLKERKAQAKAEEAELENQYKTEKISAEEYYNGLMDIAERYYAGIGELREEYLSAENKVYEGLKKAQEDELSNAKKLEDQLRAVKDAEDELRNAQTQQVSVYSAAAGYHAEVNTAAIEKARQTLADKNYTLAETLLKNARFSGESLAERLQSIGLADIRAMLPDLSGLRLPSMGGGTTTTNNSTRNITYNGGDINITITGSVDEATLPKLKNTVEDSVRKVIEQMLDEENAKRQTGGI